MATRGKKQHIFVFSYIQKKRDEKEEKIIGEKGDEEKRTFVFVVLTQSSCLFNRHAARNTSNKLMRISMFFSWFTSYILIRSKQHRALDMAEWRQWSNWLWSPQITNEDVYIWNFSFHIIDIKICCTQFEWGTEELELGFQTFHFFIDEEKTKMELYVEVISTDFCESFTRMLCE